MCPQSVCIVTATMFPSLLLNLAWRGCKRWANKHDGCVTSSTDNEYLVMSEGSVHRHNALTGQSSELINQNLFVSLLPADHKQTGSCVSVCVFVWQCVCEHIRFIIFVFFFFPSPNGQNERNAIDYHLSADHKYVAFVSNYTKVCRTCSRTYSKQAKGKTCLFVCLFDLSVSLSHQLWRHSFKATYSIYDLDAKWVSRLNCTAEGLIKWSTSVKSIHQTDVTLAGQTRPIF